MLWCAATLMAGIAVGLNHPLPYYLPTLAVFVIACTLTRRTRHLHDVLTLVVWLLLGCSRASVTFCDTVPAWQQSIRQEARTVQTSLAARLERSGVSPKTLALTSALTIGKKDGLGYETKETYRKVGRLISWL